METVDVTPEMITEGLGAFDELEFLGKGTFGTTFRVARGDRESAIKVIHRLDMPSYLWDRELASLKGIDHPNIVGFRGSGSFEATGKTLLFSECEYINGGSIQANIEVDRHCEGDGLRALLTGLLAGAEEAHDLGIIHRGRTSRPRRLR